MDHGSVNALLIYAVVFLIIFFATLTDIVKEYRFRKKAKKWHGITTGAITEIKLRRWIGRQITIRFLVLIPRRGWTCSLTQTATKPTEAPSIICMIGNAL